MAEDRKSWPSLSEISTHPANLGVGAGVAAMKADWPRKAIKLKARRSLTKLYAKRHKNAKDLAKIKELRSTFRLLGRSKGLNIGLKYGGGLLAGLAGAAVGRSLQREYTNATVSRAKRGKLYKHEKESLEKIKNAAERLTKVWPHV